MASHRLKRAMRGALAATTVLTAVSLMPSLAAADPNTPPSTDPVQQYKQLAAQADALNEQVNNALNDLNNKKAELGKANADLAAAKQVQDRAQASIEQFRVQADKLAAASFEGAHFSSLSALLTGTNAQDFLDRANMMSDLATDNATVLNGLQDAYNQAAGASARAAADEQKAQDATNAATALLNNLQQQRQQLLQQESKVQAALYALTGTQRRSLSGVGDCHSLIIIPPLTVAGAAMETALGECGVPYVWGGASPSGFDCSGLVMWSFAHHGISLPHSSGAQAQIGTPVSRANLQPGDVVYFGHPVHHVGIYVGNGEMVDAPTEGQDVKVEPLDSDYAGARRIAG